MVTIDRNMKKLFGSFAGDAVLLFNKIRASKARIEEIVYCMTATIPDSAGDRFFRRLCYLKKVVRNETMVVYSFQDLLEYLRPENKKLGYELMYLVVGGPYEDFEPKSREWFYRQITKACESDDAAKYVKRVIKKVLSDK